VGRTGAEIVRGAVFTARVNGPDMPVAPELSATETEKVDVPVADGVPEIMPVVVPSESPAGRLPLEMLQVYGATPEVLNAEVI
jgi:hypothetical protein